MPPRLHQLDTLRRMFRHPRASRDELQAFQLCHLRRVLRRAYDKVPFYRRKFDAAGLHPEDVRSLEDYKKIPITTKQELRATSLEDRLASDAKRKHLTKYFTSGSTGQPLQLYRERYEDHLVHMFRWRYRQQIGVGLRDRTAPIVEHAPSRSAKGSPRLFRRNRTMIDALAPTDEIIARLEERDPHVVLGYPAVLARLGKELERHPSPRIRPRVVMTGAEALTPALRRRIGQSFRAEVYDSYGAYEFNILAWECPQHGRLHVCEDNVIFELLDGERPVAPGESGEVVATSLHSYAMPFIRYRVMDLARREADSCPCGQPFATITSIDGRAVDYFRLPGGREVHPYHVANPLEFEDHPWLDQYQIAQENERSVVLRIAFSSDPPAGVLERLDRHFKGILGEGVGFRIEAVADFPSERGRKFRTFLTIEQATADRTRAAASGKD